MAPATTERRVLSGTARTDSPAPGQCKETWHPGAGSCPVPPVIGVVYSYRIPVRHGLARGRRQVSWHSTCHLSPPCGRAPNGQCPATLQRGVSTFSVWWRAWHGLLVGGQ